MSDTNTQPRIYRTTRKKRIPTLFEERLRLASWGELTVIAKETGFTKGRISQLSKLAKEDFNWAYNKKKKNSNQTAFTLIEEKELKDLVETIYIKEGRQVSDRAFKNIARQKWVDIHPELPELIKFQSSNGFVHRFKKRHRFTSRRGHVKRRSNINIEEGNKFIAEVKEIMENSDHNHILNVDETCWLLMPKHLETWAHIGAESVPIYTQVDPKKKVTVVATITAAGKKLPLQIITCGTTERVEKNIPDSTSIWKSHSKNGWTTSTTFISYLKLLREYFNRQDKNEYKLYLILDRYKAHLSSTVQEAARTFNISLHFIPASQTDILQPLDIGIFGPLKKKAQRLYNYRIEKNQGLQTEITLTNAIEDLIKSWTTFDDKNVIMSWKKYLSYRLDLETDFQGREHVFEEDFKTLEIREEIKKCVLENNVIDVFGSSTPKEICYEVYVASYFDGRNINKYILFLIGVMRLRNKNIEIDHDMLQNFPNKVHYIRFIRALVDEDICIDLSTIFSNYKVLSIFFYDKMNSKEILIASNYWEIAVPYTPIQNLFYNNYVLLVETLQYGYVQGFGASIVNDDISRINYRFQNNPTLFFEEIKRFPIGIWTEFEISPTPIDLIYFFRAEKCIKFCKEKGMKPKNYFLVFDPEYNYNIDNTIYIDLITQLEVAIKFGLNNVFDKLFLEIQDSENNSLFNDAIEYCNYHVIRRYLSTNMIFNVSQRQPFIVPAIQSVLNRFQEKVEQ